MKFKRARSDEQKSIRIHQIVTATLELLQTQSFDDITLKAIAEKLDFSRNNLYKYVSTKEEIFLLIVDADLQHFTEIMSHRLDNRQYMEIPEFCHLWVKTLYEQKRLLKCFSMLNTMIEKNASLDALVSFKQSMYQSLSRLEEIMLHSIPNISSEAVKSFLYFQFHYACGLYSSTEITDLQKKAIFLSGIPTFEIDFVTEFSKITSIILKEVCSNEING